jgi:hypothetical protein
MRVGLVISFLFSCAILYVNPYRRRSDDRMHMMSQVGIHLILLAAVVWQTLNYSDTGPLALTDVAISAILILVIVVLLALFIYQGTFPHPSALVIPLHVLTFVCL